jgi:transketolase C-terminal domain/subunit
MTPGEVDAAWQDFLDHDDPVIVSEHRESFANAEELPDVVLPNADVVLYGISNPRFALEKAAAFLAGEGIRASRVHLFRLKPLELSERVLAPLRDAACGLVVDPGFEICGASRSIAYELAVATGRPVRALGLRDRTKCLVEPLRNAAPGADEIAEAARGALRGR